MSDCERTKFWILWLSVSCVTDTLTQHSLLWWHWYKADVSGGETGLSFCLGGWLTKCFPLSQTHGTVTSWVPQFLNCRNQASLQRWRIDGGRKNVVEASARWVAVIIELAVSCCQYWINGELLELLNWWVAGTIELVSCCQYWISGELLSLLN